MKDTLAVLSSPWHFRLQWGWGSTAWPIKASGPLLFPQDMKTPNFPLQRFHTPSQSSQGHHQAGSAAPLLGPCKYPSCKLLHLTGTLTLPGSNCKKPLQLCYQEMRCLVRKIMLLQAKLWNRVPWKSLNPLGLCLSIACPLEPSLISPLPSPLVSREAFNIGNSSAWDLKRVLLALLWMEMDLSL